MKLRFLNIPLLIAAASATLHSQTVLEDFEYATPEDLTAAWVGSANAQVTSAGSVATTSTGQKSMQVNFAFPSTPFATETITGPERTAPVSILPTQYLSFRIKGDPAFGAADFRNLYLYAYDADGNFGRWGAAVPVTADWRVANYLASNVEQPWNSTALPDLSRIVKFAFFQYGSEAAIPAYNAAIYIDDLTLRDTALIETPPSTNAPATERLIEGFEFVSNETLAAAWRPSANALVATSAAVASGSTGQTAMTITFNFPSTVWATEAIRGVDMAAPIAIGTNQYLTFRLKGDPAFASADFRNLYLYAYDRDGNFGRWGAPVSTNDAWQIVNYPVSSMEKPWDSAALPNLADISRFAFFQYGSETQLNPYSAAIAIDDLQVRNAPLVETPAVSDRIVEGFETFPTSEDLALSWVGTGNALVTLDTNVSHKATGTNSMRVDFNFPSTVWATETIRGPEFAEPLSIRPDQYVTFRVKGDTNFAVADFRNLYLYAYDAAGNFGRWGRPIPATNDWQIVNFRANTMEAPWDSPGLPDLNNVVRFAFFQYGSETALSPYSATIYIDEIMVRNSPLTEFPAPSAPRGLIEDFQAYNGTADILNAYTYVNSPAATVTTASIGADGANKALQLAIDFAPGQYPWGSIRSKAVAPFSFPTNAVVRARFKGDAALAPVADGATTFWITFYDASGGSISYQAQANVVTNPTWTTIEAPLSAFSGNLATVDIGNLVQWRILVQGWEGTAESAALSATFQVDDIEIVVPSGGPALSISRLANQVVITWPPTVSGFTLESSAALPATAWQTVPSVGNTATVPIAAGARFFRLRQ